MKCYKCGSFLYDGEYCSTCGADVTVYREIVLKSNDFYNSALEYARDRNLSKAIEHLRISLKLYKGNINAHNLLGLAYFETGEYALGFAHWVISKNIQADNNLANSFLNQIQDDKAYFDAINANIAKYNKAMGYVEQGSYDLAEIQLKKLLNDNTCHMVSAFQLAALLKIRKKKYAAARKILNRVQLFDAGNPTTIAYSTFVNSQIKDEEKDLTSGELKSKRQQENVENDQHSPLSGDDVIIPKSSYKEYNPTTVAVIQILAGFLVGAALIFFIVVPAKTNSVRTEAVKVQTELESQIAELTKEKEQLAVQVNNSGKSAAEVEKSDVSADNGDNAENNTSQTADQKLLSQAYDAYQDGDMEKCADYLLLIEDADAFNDEDKATYDSMSNVPEQATNNWFEDGMTKFESNDFEGSLEQFTKVYKVSNTTGEALYYMALCYYNMDDNANAQKYFQEYIDTYPEGDHINECYYLLEQVS